jgi:hypothetical protein
MNGFLDVQRFEFPKECLVEAYSFLGQAGTKSFEAVALFAGQMEGTTARIQKVLLPLQRSYKTKSGLLYEVDGEELHRINVELYKSNLKLFAQIHSHPSEAYHSETDDEFAIVATIGGLSIVVPNFAQEKLDHLTWAYYRLSKNSAWIELEFQSVKELIIIH